jgi:flagellar hook-associated protein 3 FlgL
VRIADKMNYEQVNANLGKNRSEMSELQNQAATQKRVTKPSDDPLAATRVLQTRTEIASGKQFLKSIAQAKNFLEYSDQSLGELSDILMRAKELAISQSSDASASEQTRQVAGTEIRQLFSQAVQVGNRKQGDRFLFGGFKTTKAPFDAGGNYHGDSGEMKIVVNKEAKVAMNMPGDRIFLGQTAKVLRPEGPPDSNREDFDIRSTEEDLGRLARGPASLTERSALTKDLERDGVHLLRDELEKNLKSNDVPPPPTPEADVSDQWKQKGTNVFKVLGDLEISLKSNDKGGVQESLDRLDEALSQVVISRAELGSRAATLTSATDSLQKGQVDAKTLASNLEDVDTFQLVSDMNQTESTLKASLATSGKLIQPSLLDFLK